MVQKKIKQMTEEASDINPYGATNQAEFFAVVSEYFFRKAGFIGIKTSRIVPHADNHFSATTGKTSHQLKFQRNFL